MGVGFVHEDLLLMLWCFGGVAGVAVAFGLVHEILWLAVLLCLLICTTWAWLGNISSAISSEGRAICAFRGEFCLHVRYLEIKGK